MLHVQILTRNNQTTIQRTLESLQALDAEVTIGDLGSTDDTLEICEDFRAIVERFGPEDRSVVRNRLSKPGLNLAVEPWEVLVKGRAAAVSDCAYVTILNKKLVSKEIRLWKHGTLHRNPTFESPDCSSDTDSDIVLYAVGQRDYEFDREMIGKWKAAQPTAAEPHYFQACVDLAEQRYEEFIRNALHYLFLDKSPSVTATMTRYYLALVYLMHRKESRPALQNINLCLCVRPLMAEFWCLMGDVYYHLLRKFPQAMEFYENAMILGARRLKSDRWPMDISKYREYPTKMMASCEKLQNKFAIYASKSLRGDSRQP